MGPWSLKDYAKSLIARKKNSEENISNSVSSTVPADGLAPLGARTSAGTVMTKLRSHICSGLALEWLNSRALNPSVPFVTHDQISKYPLTHETFHCVGKLISA